MRMLPEDGKPDVIYLLSPSEAYWDDTLDGFAYGVFGIERFIRDYYQKYLGATLSDVRVDLEAGTVRFALSDGFECTYYIRELRRH